MDLVKFTKFKTNIADCELCYCSSNTQIFILNSEIK